MSMLLFRTDFDQKDQVPCRDELIESEIDLKSDVAVLPPPPLLKRLLPSLAAPRRCLSLG